MDVPELLKVRDLLLAKYSKTILPDREIGVYPRLVLKLSMSYPERELCEKYLEAIADNFGVDWSIEVTSEEEEEKSVDLVVESKLEIISNGNSVDSIPSASSASSTSSVSSLSEPPPYSSAPLPMDYTKQQLQQQQQRQQQQQTKQNLPDFDEFTRRFEALRKK